jgi:hypothetical protein
MRSMRPLVAIALALLPLLLLGCASDHSFDVSVKNATDRPLTIGFVKLGAQATEDWASPESFALLPPSRQPIHWGVVIDPHTIASRRVTGSFEPGTEAQLRVYGGAHELNDLLAISRGTGDRLDLMLVPGGHNDFIITEPDGHLAAHLTDAPPLPPPSPHPQP